MPEGPEVKIVSDYLNKELKNQIITSFEYCSAPYKVKYSELIHELNKLVPLNFDKVFCIGKTSFIKLSNDKYFSYHLGMTGSWSTEKFKHAHLKVDTKQKKSIYFHDIRRFGNIKLISQKDLEKKYFCEGDFLNFNTDLNTYTNRLHKTIKSDIEVCKILLNQKYFCGVGNYLKSEILYYANIHPHTKWQALEKDDIYNICKYTQKVILEAYKKGGAELRDFKNPDKESKLKLESYGQKQDSKGREIINDITKDNRRSYWCPEIQIIKTS